MNSIQFTLNQWEFRSHTVHELSAPGATGTAAGQREMDVLGAAHGGGAQDAGKRAPPGLGS